MRYFRQPKIGNTKTALFIVLGTIAVWMSPVHASDDAPPIEVDPQPLAAALNSLSEQSGLQFAYVTTVASGIESPGTSGATSPADALDSMLAGTGLTYSYINDTTVAIAAVERPDEGAKPGKFQPASSLVLMAQNQTSAEQSRTSSQSIRNSTNDEDTQPIPLEEIIVTGSSIRGVIPESSPLHIYDADDIRNTGALTVEQFVSRLPQNNNTLSEIGGGSSSRSPNSSSNNSVDLRGLGVGSTLVLLNGRRMAPSSSGRTPDLSFIPIGVVERVEVLTDGASAIYGADAIGGVVNFILKDQQDGAETVLTFGGADGGSEQWRIDQSFGFNWTDGNALIAASYFDRNSLDAEDRDFSRAAAPFTLVPEDTRINVLATISQLVAGDVRISGDLLYSTREPRSVRAQPLLGGDDFSVRVADQEQTVLNLALERPFGERLNAALLITFADASTDITGVVDGPAVGSGPFRETEDTTTLDITAKVDGELASFRSGTIMFALGAGYAEDEFESLLDFSVPQGFPATMAALDRDTKYAFAELQIPIASPSQNVSGIRRLELNLAARYTDYSDFGDDTSPKFGLLWSPVEQLKIRGTFSESFKAPFLFQRDSSGALNALIPAAAVGVPDIWTPDNSAVIFFLQGAGNPTLGPENAETTTLGFDFDFSNLTISATYFNIDYTDRVSKPDPTNGIVTFSNPQDFPDLFDLNPTLDEITTALSVSQNFLNLTGIDINDPTAVHAATTVFFDNRIRNLSISEMDGLDLRFDYTTEASGGELSFGATASKIFDFEERLSPSATPVSRVDTVLFPADLKARGYFGFRKDRWNARLNVNYVDDYDNPFSTTNPTIDDWTTVDLLFSYEFLTDGRGISDRLRLSLIAQNVFDEDPPFVPIGTSSDLSLFNPTSFDPANSNPLGRFIEVQISKTW